MIYDGLAIGFAVLAVLVVFMAAKLLLRPGWLLGWLKGCFGFCLVALSVAVALMAWDVFSYQQLLSEKSIATLSFEKVDIQHYRAVLVDSEAREQRFELRGDQWQLDARLFKWKGPLAAMGLSPGYRLDRLSGRYFSLDKERNSERTVYELHSNPSSTIDVWRWANQMQLPVLDALYGSATFVPMSDGALFEVSLASSGLIARPLNERAQTAIARWQ